MWVIGQMQEIMWIRRYRPLMSARMTCLSPLNAACKNAKRGLCQRRYVRRALMCACALNKRACVSTVRVNRPRLRRTDALLICVCVSVFFFTL